MKFSLIIAFLPFIAARVLRWLAIVQQKEYRFDRLKLFISSEEGISELFLPPKLKIFSKVGLKRPIITFRIIFTGILLIVFFVFVLNIFYFFSFTLLSLALLMLYLIVPILVLFFLFPSFVINNLLTLVILFLAKKRLEKYQPTIIGITGSYGKTSTKIILSDILSTKYSVFTTPKSFNTKLAIAKSILNYYLGQEIVVIEYAAYKKGEIKTLIKYFPPHIAVITGIAPQHIGLFGNLKNLISAKAELVEALPKNGIAFCNSQDKEAKELCKKMSQKKVYYYNSSHSQVLKNLRINTNGKLTFEFENKDIHTNIIGLHYASNILAAVLVSRHLGLSTKDINTRLKSFKPTKEFIYQKKLITKALLIDDSGTSNPKGFQEAIKLVQKINREKNILIFGGIVDLGSKSLEIHHNLAKKAKNVFSIVLYTGFEGKNIFKVVFKNNLIHKYEKMKRILKQTDNNTLILVEGRIPKDLKIFISQL